MEAQRRNPRRSSATFVAFTMTLRRPRWLKVPGSVAPVERRARIMASVPTPDGKVGEDSQTPREAPVGFVAC